MQVYIPGGTLHAMCTYTHTLRVDFPFSPGCVGPDVTSVYRGTTISRPSTTRAVTHASVLGSVTSVTVQYGAG